MWEIVKDLYRNGTAIWWERSKGEPLIPALERNYTVLVPRMSFSVANASLVCDVSVALLRSNPIGPKSQVVGFGLLSFETVFGVGPEFRHSSCALASPLFQSSQS